MRNSVQASSPTFPSALRTLACLTALIVAGLAAAQVDDRARELLSGLQADAPDLRTLDQTTVMTLLTEGAGQVVRSRSIIDYEGRRAAIDTELAPGMTVRIVVADGQARMVMGGMALPVPPEMGGDFAGMFERSPDLLAEGVEATYDGVHAYGDLVEGEQVTLRNAAGFPGLEEAQESRLLFDAQGRLLAIVADVPEMGVMVSVFDEPFRGNPTVGRDATVYLVGDDGPVPFMTLHFEDVRVNEPIDPATFE